MTVQPAPLDFLKAVELIVSTSLPTGSEQIRLQDALGRVPAQALRSRIPQPAFNQSIRDGFVVADSGFTGSEKGNRYFHLEREIAAGPGKECTLPKGKTGRIMTGGLIPKNGVRVIPFEDCCEKDGLLAVAESSLSKRDTFIRKKGSQIGINRVVVADGVIINADHLALLAETGIFAFDVFKKVRVAYFCTGSELQSAGEPQTGMKISANRYLLDSLITSFGAIPDDRGIVQDISSELCRTIEEIDLQKVDVIISTGGMGPGKYDLLEGAFVAAGGKILYRSLNVRPGKSTLFGLLGTRLFFGLPGPPPAVRALFNELIRPALLTMQGVRFPLPRSAEAFLLEDFYLKRGGVFGLKGGRLFFREGKCMVRKTKRNESPNCYLLFQPTRQQYRKNELITVHFTDSPFAPCQ